MCGDIYQQAVEGFRSVKEAQGGEEALNFLRANFASLAVLFDAYPEEYAQFEADVDLDEVTLVGA